MKKIFKPQSIFLLFCIGLFVISLTQIVLKLKGYTDGNNTYQEAEARFGISSTAEPDSSAPQEPNDPLLAQAAGFFKDCDFDALTAVNPETIAWIVIPGTNISYPVCQHDDNQYYLDHTSQKESSFVGSIFADYRLQDPFKEFNTILYGHRLLNQTMFSALKTYRQKDVWEKHPYIYIYTPEQIYVYEIYAVFQGDPTGESYHTSINTKENRQNFIDYTLSNAEYDTGITPTTEDSILTLSTCTGKGHAKRLIVHSVLRANAPSASLPGTQNPDT